jgi:hypothetical protein
VASRLTLFVRMGLGVLALALPPLCLLAAGAGWVLFDRDVIDLDTGLAWLAVCAGAGAAAIVILLAGRSAGWISWRWMFLLALPALVPIGAGVYAMDWLRNHPSLRDVTSDWIDPPAFGGSATPYPPALLDQLRHDHPGVRSVTLKAPPAEAFDRAMGLVQANGWTVTAQSADQGVAEGRGTFGRFRDQRQWSLRVRPELGGGSIVDFRLRSLSDTPDFGGNAEVASAFLDRLRHEAG